MRREIRAVVTAVALVGASQTLVSCGLLHKRVAATKPVPSPATRPAPLPAALAAAPGRPSAAVWNLRAGLNVAALSCRGGERRPVAGDYATLLTRHRTLLAAAYREEQGRQDAGAFDRQQTRVYNSFANQTSAPHFCNAAHSVAQRANALDSAKLAMAAPRLLSELAASLRYRPLKDEL